ncbi:uncharacterized protein F4807DRAFT_471165 [Annulohypoxylon truncatum]|uniref:uncharacterized protein n=1 Tax=Annulohypoxylon truncatum TaxID=327061 RepID=UPI0020082CEF|nr:uncharacterized protein F4807DRAFT_471165 [Annulohypoxylon truncatum]KAI1205315.1 hypothetical protein F4807DRAFT_471165 [Annulohypoxylon truncatum]
MMEFLRSIIHIKPKTPISPEVRDIITSKKHQYCRFADTNQWQDMFKVALPEATFRFTKADGTFINEDGQDYNFSSTAEFIKCLGGRNMQGVHLIGPGELEQTSPDEVKAIWSLIYHAGMKESNLEHNTGGGYYYETWRRKGNDWFIQDLMLERTYFQIVG